MNKAFNPFTWVNSPSVATSLGQINLNKINSAVDTIDDRVILLDSDKANVTDVNGCLSNVTYDTETGVISFEWKDGTTYTIDLNIEKIPVSFSMDENGVITMVCEDGTTYTADIGAILPVYTFVDSAQLDFTVTVGEDGAYNVTATIKAGSITDAMLESGYLASIQLVLAQATAQAENAADSATLAESYTHGNTGSRTGEETDNAMYFAQQAANSAAEAQAYVDVVVPTLYIDVPTGRLMQNDDGNNFEFTLNTTTGYLEWEITS